MTLTRDELLAVLKTTPRGRNDMLRNITETLEWAATAIVAVCDVTRRGPVAPPTGQGTFDAAFRTAARLAAKDETEEM